ncbi:SulP family inorganic anion transporter [Peredibacter sp. HCB2-198]|uniref:SulP family inorganic anion transporter n=1 Tax=Peredibacter sp. HCB2-198 TaxID=3383025 RepID=UPI0038B4B40E
MKNTSDFKFDFMAGFSVALVALPLSIGIALASGAPASAGLIAAIIGGLLGSWMGGSHVTINGPAAGLIVIVLEAVNKLGFKGMLGAAIVAGALQIAFGLMKLARKGLAFPVSVIHGMMASIGLIIIAKQFHLMVGHVPVNKNPLMLIAEIPMAFTSFDKSVFIIGAASLALLIMWNQLTWAPAKKVPGPLLAVIVGAGLASFLGMDSSKLLSIPADVKSWVIFPEFTSFSTFDFWKSAITLALVGTLETTLSAAAVDKIDPQKRKSDLDRDLISKGICNILSASLGGLPMIAEIVRSSANVSFGAKTWKSNFFHGALILVAVLALPSVLSYIPIAALAAILVMIGYRLGSPKHFHHALKIGKDNLTGFLVTLLVTLSVDLLMGIFLGALAQFAVEIYLGLKLRHSLKASYTVEKQITGGNLMKVDSALTFSNFLGVKDEILRLTADKKEFKLDLTHSPYVDHSVMDQINDLKEYFQNVGIPFQVIISPEHYALGVDQLSAVKKKLAAA